MSTQKKQKHDLSHEPGTAPLGEEDIAAYLRDHPDFFEHQLELLTTLRVPHPCGRAVSLVERQVTALREQNKQLRQKMLDLVQAARENAGTHERVQRLTLALLETRSVDEVLFVVTDLLRNEFQADLVAFWLYEVPANAGGGDIHRLSREEPALGAFTRFFKERRPLCGRLRSEQLAFLFGEQAATVGSAVLLPLGETTPLGMLAVGSHAEDRFHPGMGTAVLRQLGELLSQALQTRV